MGKHAKLIGGPKDGEVVPYQSHVFEVAVCGSAPTLAPTSWLAQTFHREVYREVELACGVGPSVCVLLHEGLRDADLFPRLIDHYQPIAPSTP